MGRCYFFGWPVVFVWYLHASCFSSLRWKDGEVEVDSYVSTLDVSLSVLRCEDIDTLIDRSLQTLFQPLCVLRSGMVTWWSTYPLKRFS